MSAALRRRIGDTASVAVTIRWLGHSTVVLDIAGVRLVTDPLLQRHAGPLRRHAPRPDPTTYAGCDAVLLSHLHHDHAELSSLRRLTGPILTTEANARWLRRHDLPVHWGTLAAPLTRRLAPRGWFERPGFVLLLLTLLITLYDRYRTVRVIRERDARTPRQPVLV